MAEPRLTLYESALSVDVTGTTETEFHRLSILSGWLKPHGSIIVTAIVLVDFSPGAVLTVRSNYGLAPVVAAATFGDGSSTSVLLRLESRILAGATINVQRVTLSGLLGVELASGSSPAGSGSGTETMGADRDFWMTFQWSGTGTARAKHILYEKTVAPSVAAFAPSRPAPVVRIVSSGVIAQLPQALYAKSVVFAQLFHDLTLATPGYGPGLATFTGPGGTAVWRDGFSHTIAVNKPRFEYDGAEPQGIAIATGETLTFPAAFHMADAGELFWQEDRVTKYTFVNANPFSGNVWSVLDVHASNLLKFPSTVTLTPSERSIILDALS